MDVLPEVELPFSVACDIARREGKRYVMDYSIHAQSNGDKLSGGLLNLMPSLTLEEAFNNAAISNDLDDNYLIAKNVYDVTEGNKPVEGFPKVITGAQKPLNSGRGLH